MKVVIIDDEEKVCSLICTLIDWDRLGLELAGTASDGISGLELVSKAQPDLLVTDIRMPGMSGLQLIEEAKKILPDLLVVLISGYSQFDYAQSAIRYGVVNYLLKPVKKNELNDTLQKMAAGFVRRQNELSHTQQIEEQIARIIKERRQNALLSVITDGNTREAGAIELPFPVSIVAVKVDGRTLPYDMKAAGVLINRIREHIGDMAGGNAVCTVSGTCVVAALGATPSASAAAEELLVWCKEQTELFRAFTLTAAESGGVEKEEDYHDGVLRAFCGIAERLGNGTLCLYQEKEPEREYVFDCTPYVNTVIASVIKDDAGKFEETAQAFRDAVVKTGCSLYQLTIIIDEFKNEMLEEARLQLEDRAYEEVEQLAPIVEMADSVEAVWRNLKLFLEKVYEAVGAGCREKYARPVREAQQYIQEHYGDSLLSLNSVADYVGLNSTYFSGLFKKNCSVGFADYLQNLRLAKAKEFLTRTKNPIKQISAEVGYSDPKHFSRIFKSITGIKPNEYRQLYE